MTQTATELLPHPGERPVPRPAVEPEFDPTELLAQESLAWRFTNHRESGGCGHVDCHKPGLLVDGDHFDPKQIPYLIDLYDEPHPRTVIEKGSQLGVTVAMVLLVIERLRSGFYPRGALYGMPTADEAHDFASSRFNRILRENPEFFAGTIRDTDSVGLKNIGGRQLYFRGVRMPVAENRTRPTKLLSFPADCEVFDEYDDMDMAAVAVALSRLGQAQMYGDHQGHVFKLGHPSSPDYGIDAEYQASDQRRWLIRCDSCGEFTCLEDDFPKCIGRVQGGPWFRCCRACQKQIYVINGQWVAKHPERDVRGMLMSRLLSGRLNLTEFIEEYTAACAGVNEKKFWNMGMARAFANLSDALEGAFAKTLFDADQPERHQFYGPSMLGCDPGAKDLHVQIGHHPSLGRDHVHWYGTVATFDELFDLGKRHNVTCGVIDGMAEARAVTDFLKRAPWAWAARYTEQAEDPTWHADPTLREVRIGRTHSLDDSHTAMVSRALTFHRWDKYAEDVMVPQLTNLVKVQVHTAVTQKTGQRKFAWHVRGVKNDHQRHATNYLRVAGKRVGVAVTPDPRIAARGERPLHWQAA